MCAFVRVRVHRRERRSKRERRDEITMLTTHTSTDVFSLCERDCWVINNLENSSTQMFSVSPECHSNSTLVKVTPKLSGESAL